MPNTKTLSFWGTLLSTSVSGVPDLCIKVAQASRQITQGTEFIGVTTKVFVVKFQTVNVIKYLRLHSTGAQRARALPLWLIRWKEVEQLVNDEYGQNGRLLIEVRCPGHTVAHTMAGHWHISTPKVEVGKVDLIKVLPESQRQQQRPFVSHLCLYSQVSQIVLP